MTSPLVTRLLAELGGTTDPEARALLLAELACYWARTGEFEQSERTKQDLRRDFGDGRSVRVSVLIMLVEALLLYYRELSPNARDRLARASLLSNAAKDLRLVALTSAWMAHIEFNQCRYDSMVEQITSSLNAIDADNGSAECRVALVLGDAFLFAGNQSASQSWYERARRVAVQIGDQAAVGAITYNRAALRVARTRFDRLSEPANLADLSLLRLDVESAINYQSVAHLQSLNHLLHTAKIGLFILQEKYDEALAPVQALLLSGDVKAESPQHIMLKADCALILAKLGRVSESQSHVAQVSNQAITSLSSDDRALAAASLHGAALSYGNHEASDAYANLMAEAISAHTSLTNQLHRKLAHFTRLPKCT